MIYPRIGHTGIDALFRFGADALEAHGQRRHRGIDIADLVSGVDDRVPEMDPGNRHAFMIRRPGEIGGLFPVFRRERRVALNLALYTKLLGL